MAIKPLPIFCYYDKQRFDQFGSMDCANWYGISVESGKKQQALYPCMGRKHVTSFGANKLIFNSEPRDLFRTDNYIYVIDGTEVIQIDKFYNQKSIGFVSLGGMLFFDSFPVEAKFYGMLTDESHCYLITEDGTSVTFEQVTDSNAPASPQVVVAFGDRFAVSTKNTPGYQLTTIDVFGGAATCFTVNGQPVRARASGIIRQMGVLHNQLYIFSDYLTDILSNTPTQITIGGATFQFPWRINTSYNFDYGIADPDSFDADFGRMAWLAQNKNGLVSFVTSTGQAPMDISSQAINVLLEQSIDQEGLSPFISDFSNGFLYQYENTVFYRVSAGKFLDVGEVDLNSTANCLEYNFETMKWGRAIEVNGERNRIQKHVFFNNQHLVTVSNDPAIYIMAGNIYSNEIINTAQSNHQAPDAFIKQPMRYELVTQPIIEEDYSEFIDKWVQIDFVFGNNTFFRSNAPFLNTQFLIAEQEINGQPIYLVAEDGQTMLISELGNTPTFDDNHYNELFKPHVELFYSDDGAETFYPLDLREFSQKGQYQYRMRWYQTPPSRDRRYKLVCVSSAPIVVLGAVRETMRSSGGAA